ncbi:hypothetical protein CS8_065320 [Cupriavidus sp. 8B]
MARGFGLFGGFGLCIRFVSNLSQVQAWLFCCLSPRYLAGVAASFAAMNCNASPYPWVPNPAITASAISDR